MNKDIKKILWVTALYSFAGGIFYNFIELWLVDNKFSTSEVSVLFSLGALFTAASVIIFSYVVKQKNLQNFALTLLIVKAVIFYLMYQLNGLGFRPFIVFLFIADFVIDAEIYILLYPLISTIEKDDKLYAKRGLIYEVFYYIAFFVSGMLIGKRLLTYKFTYNSFAIIGTFILFIAVVLLLNVNIDRYFKKEEKIINSDTTSLIKTLRILKSDKISVLYLLFLFFANISRFCILAITIIILTTKLSFSASMASNMRLLFNITSVLLASLVLRKLTFKNNYINIFIKYGIRIILYIVALINFNNITVLTAIAYTYISISMYTHVIDAPYINRFDKDEQIAFVNLREMINYLSRSIGTLICGFCIAVSLKLNIFISLVSLLIAFTFAVLANYFRTKK